MDRHTSTGTKTQTEKEEAKQAHKQGKKRKEYKCTCHVYGQTHQYGGSDQEEKPKRVTKERKCSKGGKGVLVHLSRLWTDTQVRNLGGKCPRSWRKMSEAHTSRNEPKKERQTKQRFRAMFLDLSESKFCAENLDLSCAVWMRKKYECTCHVYGQTHKYSMTLKSK